MLVCRCVMNVGLQAKSFSIQDLKRLLPHQHTSLPHSDGSNDVSKIFISKVALHMFAVGSWGVASHLITVRPQSPLSFVVGSRSCARLARSISFVPCMLIVPSKATSYNLDEDPYFWFCCKHVGCWVRTKFVNMMQNCQQSTLSTCFCWYLFQYSMFDFTCCYEYALHTIQMKIRMFDFVASMLVVELGPNLRAWCKTINNFLYCTEMYSFSQNRS